MKLVYEPSPRVPSFVPKDNTEAIGNPADGLSRFIAKAVPHRVIVVSFGGTAPGMTELVAQADEVTVAESVHGLLLRILESEKAPGSRLTRLLTPKDHV